MSTRLHDSPQDCMCTRLQDSPQDYISIRLHDSHKITYLPDFITPRKIAYLPDYMTTQKITYLSDYMTPRKITYLQDYTTPCKITFLLDYMTPRKITFLPGYMTSPFPHHPSLPLLLTLHRFFPQLTCFRPHFDCVPSTEANPSMHFTGRWFRPSPSCKIRPNRSPNSGPLFHQHSSLSLSLFVLIIVLLEPGVFDPQNLTFLFGKL